MASPAEAPGFLADSGYIVMFGSRLAALLVLAPALLLCPPRSIHAQAAPGMGENATEADESVAHEGPWIRSIESALIAENFDVLDQMASQYRTEKSRLPGGDWRLRRFYAALDAPQQTDKGTQDHLAHLQNWIAQHPESITAR